MHFQYGGNSKKSGIYRIVNTINGRFYIGSTSEFKRRWKQHKKQLEDNKHPNKFLLSDYQKCGKEAFLVEVVEVVSGSKKERLGIEQAYLDIHYDKGQRCYNLSPYAISPKPSKLPGQQHPNSLANLATRRGALHTPESKQQMSLSKIGMFSGEKHPMFGKKHTDQAKLKNSLAHRGSKNRMFGKKHTAESNKKRSRTRSRQVAQLDLNGVPLATFLSALEAERVTGVHRCAISRCIHGSAKTAGGYLWRRPT